MLSTKIFVGTNTKMTLNKQSIKFAPQLIRHPAAVLALALLLIVLLMGCGGGSSDDGGPVLLSGTFLDDAVEGLHYATPSQAGVTGTGGTFNYFEGETVSFFMGDVMLGQGPAQAVMTPIDLVPGAVDETHPAVTNICRVLQTMDQDGNPDNGIHLSTDAVDLMMGTTMIFDMHPDDFDNETAVMQFMNDLEMLGPDYTGRTMVTAPDAQAHLRNTMMDMGMMGTAPVFPQTGVFIDSAVEGLYYETHTQSGFTDAHGTFTYMDGEEIRFFMGDVMLGQALAQNTMTPVNLVPGATDETHPAVTNMARLLQTLDHNDNPADGITLPALVEDEMRNRHIDFTMTPDNFELQADVTMLMDALAAQDPAYAGRMLVTAESAQAHMGQTLADIMTPGDGLMGGGDNTDGMPGQGSTQDNGMGGGNMM